jgi:hypothetical protein
MATGTTAARTPSAKYDNQIATQLARAESRVRTLDLTAGLLGLAALTLLFAVVMVFCDSKLGLSPSIRQMALAAFLLGGGAYAWFAVVEPLRRRINPYYAALKVEALIPGAKNSIVNWVDLHGASLPPAIRAAVGHRAAKDLARADVDRAVSGKRAGWAGGVAAAAFVLFFIAWLLLGRSPFFSLLGRTFAPFGGAGIATRNSIDVITPEGGDATLPIGRPFNLLVEVRGPAPDPKSSSAVRLLFRYDESEAYIERLLQPEQGQRWTTTLTPPEVQNGFWYRVAAGDAATPEYRVRYRAAPFITDFLATYHFRPYVARIDELHHDHDLKAFRGTEITLRVRTNRTLQSARLEWEGRNEPVAATLIPGDPQVFEVRVVLKEDGKYRLAFTPTDESPYTEPQWYSVTAVPDQPPKVELTRPGTDVKLPANGLLELEGTASDDIGVKSITLRSQVVTGPGLKAKPYRGDDGLKLETGGYPLAVGYKDFLDLSKVQTEGGKPFELRPGMELEYWLEAADACDFDRPNVSVTKRYRVQIIEPEKDAAQQKKDRERAEREQKQHEQEQDRKQKEEAKKREQDREDQKAANEAEKQKSEEAKPQNQPGKEGNSQTGDPKDNGGKTPEGQKPDGQGDNPDPQRGLDKDTQEKQKRLQEAVDRKKAEEENKPGNEGQGKDNSGQNPGEGKDGGSSTQTGGDQPPPGANGQQDGTGKKGDNADSQKAGEGKDGGKPDAGEKQGQDKPQGNPDPMNTGHEGEGKQGGDRSEAGDQPKGADKPHDSKAGATGGKDGEAKKGGRAEGEKPAESKAGGKPDAGQNAGEGKTQGNSDPMNTGHEGEGKDGGQQSAAGNDPRGNDKPHDGKPSGSKPQTADARPQQGQGEGKQGGSPQEQKAAAAGKPEGNATSEAKDGHAEGKGQPTAQERNQTAEKKGQPGSSAQSEAKSGGNDPSQQRTAGSGKSGNGQSSGGGDAAAEGKSGKADGKDQKVAEGKPRPGKGGPQGTPEDTTPEDVARLAQHLRDQDERSRRDAQQRLEQIKDRAKDPKARDDAAEALKKDGEGSAEPAEAKGGPKEGSTPEPKGSDPTASGKDRKGDSPDSGTSKKEGGPPDARQGEGKGGKQGDSSDGKAPESSGTAKSYGKHSGNGNDPGNGSVGDRHTAGNGGPSAPPLPGKGDKPGPHRPSMLQLEEFKKLVDKKVLKDAKLSEAEYQRFLKAYEEAARHQKDFKVPDQPSDSGPRISLPSVSGSSKPPDSSTDDLRGDGRALPPPAYRDAYREFTKQFSRPPEKK